MTLPPLTDHAFMRLVRKRCEDYSRSMAEIAMELGCTPDELCRWIMAYREPRPAKPVAPVAPITFEGRPLRNMDEYDAASRFAAWRRSRKGAKAQLALNAGEAR